MWLKRVIPVAAILALVPAAAWAVEKAASCCPCSGCPFCCWM